MITVRRTGRTGRATPRRATTAPRGPAHPARTTPRAHTTASAGVTVAAERTTKSPIAKAEKMATAAIRFMTMSSRGFATADRWPRRSGQQPKARRFAGKAFWMPVRLQSLRQRARLSLVLHQVSRARPAWRKLDQGAIEPANPYANIASNVGIEGGAGGGLGCAK
jgi:hypothetical protein